MATISTLADQINCAEILCLLGKMGCRELSLPAHATSSQEDDMPPQEKSVALCVCGDPACAVPYGYCHCLCGRQAPIATRNFKARKLTKGEPHVYIHGHNGTQNRPNFDDAKPFKIDGVYCKLIPLSQGNFAIVWEEDYLWLKRWVWTARIDRRGKAYAFKRNNCANGKSSIVLMHRLIAGDPDGLTIDHISGITLDNRRENLRPATNAEQSRNRGKFANNTSGFKGVIRRSATLFRAQIRVNGVLINLGSSRTAAGASILYKEAANKYFGEFARGN